MSKLTYRTANIADLSQLKKLGKVSYLEFSKVLAGEHWEKMYIFLDDEKTLIALIQQSTVLVCEQDGEIVGMVYLVKSGIASDHYEEDWGRIRYLAVHPNSRKKGIAKKLTQMCIQLAKENGEQNLALHTSEFMTNARKMYESLGFKQVKDFQLYGKKYWIYLLALN